jgi:hypothetical protein
VVRVDRTPHEGRRGDRRLDGHPGVHILHAPAAPVVDLDDLNDAGLDSMSAGSDPSIFFIKG